MMDNVLYYRNKRLLQRHIFHLRGKVIILHSYFRYFCKYVHLNTKKRAIVKSL